MNRYNVIKADNYNYTLKDEVGDIFNISLQFYDVTPPQKGEYIWFSEKLLDKKANEGLVHFSFGKLTEKYGRKITQQNIKDNIDEILLIERDNKKLCLKRFYG